MRIRNGITSTNANDVDVHGKQTYKQSNHLPSFNSKLRFEPHMSYITRSAARCLYGLKTLRAHGLAGKSLWDVTQATLIARILYAAPAWWGFLNAAEKDRIESVINKAQRYGYLQSSFENVHSLVDNMESKLFNCILFYLIRGMSCINY